MNHEDTHYRLADHVYDLTAIQTYFLYLCAKEKHDEYENIRNSYSNGSSCDNPYRITDDDSEDEIRDKIDLIKMKAMGQ